MVTLSAPVLSVRSASRVFGRGVTALDDVSIGVRPGELVYLAGDNGSGKSTLMRMLALEDRPSSGQVMVDGRDPNRLAARARDDVRGTEIEYIPQHHLGLRSGSALENVAYWLRRYDGLPGPQARRVAADALAEVGMGAHLIDRPVERLSGGEQARVAIAKALARRRPICVADEVLAAVDEVTRPELARLFRMLAGRGVAVVVIAHDSALIEYFDRVVRLKDGRLVEDRHNPTPTILARPSTPDASVRAARSSATGGSRGWLARGAGLLAAILMFSLLALAQTGGLSLDAGEAYPPPVPLEARLEGDDAHLRWRYAGSLAADEWFRVQLLDAHERVLHTEYLGELGPFPPSTFETTVPLPPGERGPFTYSIQVVVLEDDRELGALSRLGRRTFRRAP